MFGGTTEACAYNQSTINVSGGTIYTLNSYDASTVNVTGGHVSTLDARESSTANVSGGYVYTLWASDSATAMLYEDATAFTVGAHDSATVTMLGGTTEYLGAIGGGTVNLHGGNILDSLGAGISSTLNVYGRDLVKAAEGGRYGYGQVSGFWSDGTEFTIDLNGSETYSHISLITIIDAEIEIHPETLNLASKSKWITCHIWLPDEYSVGDIEPDSILLERRFKADWKWYNEKQQVVMLKFKRSKLDTILEPGDIELIVSCHLIDGTYFEGTDVTKVIDKCSKKK